MIPPKYFFTPRPALLAATLLCLLALPSHHPLMAQTQTPETRTVTYRGIAAERPIADLWVQDASGAMKRLVLSASRVSQPITSRISDSQLPLYRRLNNAALPAQHISSEEPASRATGNAGNQSADSKNIFAPRPSARDAAPNAGWEIVGNIVFPPQGKEFFLLVFDNNTAATTNTQHYLAVALPHEDLATQGGKVKFYNHSALPVACQLGKETFTIAPGSTIVRAPQQEGGEINLGLRIATQVENEWQLVFSSVWDHRPHLNTLFMLFDDPRKKGQLSVRRLFDQPAPPQEGTR